MKKSLYAIIGLVIICLLLSCSNDIEPEIIHVESVTMDRNSLELIEGEVYYFRVTINPDNASDKRGTWTNSSPYVASVDCSKVTALKAGTTTISILLFDGNK